MRPFPMAIVVGIVVLLVLLVMIFNLVVRRDEVERVTTIVIPQTYEVIFYGPDPPKVWRGVREFNPCKMYGGMLNFTDPTTGRWVEIIGGPIEIQEGIGAEAPTISEGR